MSPIRLPLVAAMLLCSAVPAGAATLSVNIDAVRGNTGTVLVAVYADPAGWAGQQPPVAATGARADGSASLQVEFDDLPAGSYAIRVLHDENDNGKMDSNPAGMPLEGYGFSNNPQVLRPATFDEARFELAEDGSAVTVELR